MTVTSEAGSKYLNSLRTQAHLFNYLDAFCKKLKF